MPGHRRLGGGFLAGELAAREDLPGRRGQLLRGVCARLGQRAAPGQVKGRDGICAAPRLHPPGHRGLVLDLPTKAQEGPPRAPGPASPALAHHAPLCDARPAETQRWQEKEDAQDQERRDGPGALSYERAECFGRGLGGQRRWVGRVRVPGVFFGVRDHLCALGEVWLVFAN